MFGRIAHSLKSLLGIRRRSGNDEPCRELEDNLKADPGNLSLRKQLTECYHGEGVRSYSGPVSERDRIAKKHAQCVLWLVLNAPADPCAGSPSTLIPWWHPKDKARIRNEWLRQTEANPSNPFVLLNAAHFFTSYAANSEDYKRAESFANRAHGLAPDNFGASSMLAHLLELKMNRATGELRIQFASQSLQLRERAIATSPLGHIDMYSELREMANDALESGELAKAEKYASDLLQLSKGPNCWAPDMAFHHGNILIGRAALRRGNLVEAKARLLGAAKEHPVAVPMLNGWGVNVILARELLERRESEVVLEYFDKCEKIWPQKATLDEWRAAIREGKMPDFGVNVFN